MANDYPNVQDIPEVQGMQAPVGPQSAQQAPVSGAQQLMNPIIGAMKVIGASIKAQQAKGNPNAAGMSQAFSGLLQNMSGQVAGANTPEVATPQAVPPAPVQQQAPQAPVGQAPQSVAPQAAPQVQGQLPQAAAQNRPAPGTQPTTRPLNNARPFGQSPGQRPISKQPVLI